MSCTDTRLFSETLSDGRTYRIYRVEDGDPAENTGVFAVPRDSYFVVGNNRDNSRDSRMDDIGYVSKDAIVGRVDVKYFDGATKRWVWEQVQ